MGSRRDAEDQPWRIEYKTGLKAYRKKLYFEAFEHLSRAIQLGGDQAAVYDLRAEILASHLGQPQNALTNAEHVIRLAPDSHQGYALAATIFAKLGNFSPAILMAKHALQRLVKTEPRYPQSRSALLHKIREYEEHRSRGSSSIATVPVEVLTAIFELGSQRSVVHVLGDKRPKGHIDNDFVIQVSHVCQHWRSIALGQPTLWQSLILGEGRLRQKAEAWATRAQGSIRELLLLPSMSDDMLARNTPLVLTLRKHIHTPPTVLRIQAGYEILLSPRDQRDWLEAAFRSSDIPLRALELSPNWPILFIPVPWQHLVVENLRELSLRCTTFLWETEGESGSDGESEEKNLDIGLQGLHVLKLRNVKHVASGLKEILSSLSRNPDLHTLLLGGSTPNENLMLEPEVIVPVVHLSRLEHFELAGTWVNSKMLFRSLSLPILQTLWLTDLGLYNPICQTLQHLNTSTTAPSPPPSLRELCIRGCTFIADDLVDALRRVGAQLEILAFHSITTQITTVLRRLAGRQQDGRDVDSRSKVTMTLPCPLLKRIAFTDVPSLRGKVIEELVMGRLSRPTHTGSTFVHETYPRTINSITVERCPNVDPETIRRLRTVVSEMRYVRDRRK
ncbi:hypothetical protein FRB98_006952 [Tulasnella sp. 332]|nr:hypothetical protein FRB98_006952 [Tulasnella sp. 332]